MSSLTDEKYAAVVRSIVEKLNEHLLEPPKAVRVKLNVQKHYGVDGFAQYVEVEISKEL